MCDKEILVSVIVPVYNVEKYISRCVDSIISQTFWNFEIILIDDGSTDKSGIICDWYQKQDERIRVIHQQNMGLAEVRNVGIREAKGKYIEFLDSDDWIENDTLQHCCEMIKKYDADIICFRFIKSYGSGKEFSDPKISYKPLLLNTNEALSKLLLPGYVEVSMCNKLIKRALFQDIVFPKGKLYEDIYTTYKVVSKAKKVLCIDNKFYHYFQNIDSIGHYEFSPTTYDLIDAANRCYEYCVQYPNIEIKVLKVGLWYWKVVVANHMIKSDKIDSLFIHRLRKAMSLRSLMTCKELVRIRKIQLVLFKVNFNLYVKVYKAFIDSPKHKAV